MPRHCYSLHVWRLLLSQYLRYAGQFSSAPHNALAVPLLSATSLNRWARDYYGSSLAIRADYRWAVLYPYNSFVQPGCSFPDGIPATA